MWVCLFYDSNTPEFKYTSTINFKQHYLVEMNPLFCFSKLNQCFMFCIVFFKHLIYLEKYMKMQMKDKRKCNACSYK